MIKLTKRLLKIIRNKQKQTMAIIVIMMFVSGILESFSITLVLPIVSLLIDEEGSKNSAYINKICELIGVYDFHSIIIIMIFALIGLFVFKALFIIFQYYIQYRFTSKGLAEIKKNLFGAYLLKPYSFYIDYNMGESMRVIGGDTGETFTLISIVIGFYTEIVVSITIAVTLLIISPVITIGVGILLLVEVIIISLFIKPPMRKIGEINREHNGLANTWILQAFQGIKGIKVSKKEDYFRDNYNVHTDLVASSALKENILGILPKYFIETFTIVSMLLIVLAMVLSGKTITGYIPELTAFALAATRLIPSANRISSFLNSTSRFEGGMENVIAALDNIDHENGVKKDNKKESKRMIFENNIEVSKLTFSYNSSEKKIFDNASLNIHKGECVGIIGTSGTGKTTLLDLLLGLLEPNEGAILVDGKNIIDNINGWLDSIEYIPQNIYLINDTIRRNVAFGLRDEEIDDERVWEALKDSQMYEYIFSSPEKLDMKVGESGVKLSGGQRQRIGIARALYCNPSVLFFDEATSALDNETETAIMESINHLIGKKTIIIVTHRLTTINKCDVVYKIENGKIIKQL